jgi:hypothetical protein
LGLKPASPPSVSPLFPVEPKAGFPSVLILFLSGLDSGFEEASPEKVFLGFFSVLPSLLFFQGKAPPKLLALGLYSRFPLAPEGVDDEEVVFFLPDDEGRFSFKELKFGPQN